QQLHCSAEALAKFSGQLGRVPSNLAAGNIRSKLLPCRPGHLLVNSLEALYQPTNVVFPILVVPDVLDDLGDRARLGVWRLCSDRGSFLEVFEQRAIEAVEHCEMRLVGKVLAFARTSAKHLLK